MAARIKRLEHLDPCAVPLPHGTEVTTRVDRVVGDRVIPQGAVGRVLSVQEGLIQVHVVGVGKLCFAREELTATKVGQAQFAARRHESWLSLGRCVVLRTVVGSRAWGLADHDSDTDMRGVFALPLSWTIGLAPPPHDLVSVDGSQTYWEVGKAIRQALRADPNTLEMLFVEGASACDEIGQWLLQARDAFVSSQIYGSFGRYALSQLKRLGQSARLASHRSTVLEWLRESPSPSLDEVASRLAQIDPRTTLGTQDAQHQAKQYVKQLYRSLHDQGLIEASDLPSMVKFAQTAAVDFDLPRHLRPKNAYNLLRLIDAATRWLREGSPQFRVQGPLRDRLLSIKQGQVSLEEVIAQAEEMVVDLESARQSTRLPEQPDLARADEVLRRVGEECARRWTQQQPGPWGTDAPPYPGVEWQAQGVES